jgi:excisionase family DNA binding protein
MAVTYVSSHTISWIVATPTAIIGVCAAWKCRGVKMKKAQMEIMTVQEVAEYLRLAEATIYKLAQSGEIPAVKLGRTWRFKKELIDEWFRQQASSSQQSVAD